MRLSMGMFIHRYMIQTADDEILISEVAGEILKLIAKYTRIGLMKV